MCNNNLKRIFFSLLYETLNEIKKPLCNVVKLWSIRHTRNLYKKFSTKREHSRYYCAPKGKIYTSAPDDMWGLDEDKRIQKILGALLITSLKTPLVIRLSRGATVAISVMIKMAIKIKDNGRRGWRRARIFRSGDVTRRISRELN